MSSPADDGYKIYKLLNDYNLKTSTLVFGRHKDEIITRHDWGVGNPPLDSLDMIQTNLIKFTSKEETMDRLGKLIIFS
jgi:hypothetical protein